MQMTTRYKKVVKITIREIQIKATMNIFSCMLGWLLQKKKRYLSVSKDGEKLKPLYTVSGHAEWCCHYRIQ